MNELKKFKIEKEFFMLDMQSKIDEMKLELK